MERVNFVKGAFSIGLLVCVISATSVAQAATDTWIGGGLDANWNTSGNWNNITGNAPPVANDSLVFDGTANLTTSNNIAANTQFNGITFNSTAGAFTLGGNAITLGGDINDNNTTLTEKITLGIVLNGGTSNVNVASGGTLTFGADVRKRPRIDQCEHAQPECVHFGNRVNRTDQQRVGQRAQYCGLERADA